MSAASLPPIDPAPSFREEISSVAKWGLARPGAVALLAACVGVMVYFFWSYAPFYNGQRSTFSWAMSAWNPENNQEHSFLVLPITLFLVWFHRREIATAPVAPSASGLWWLTAGLAFWVLGVRSLQPRLALIALPLLGYGAVRFLTGREVARVFIFPCLFLLFMVPVGGMVQGTVTLQVLVASAVKFLSSLLGIKVQADGTTLRALDGSFNFEVAEGCSGIHSLMAMTMLAALYVHFTQRGVGKQLLIFCGSVVFALIGNIGRIFTVILFARFISSKLADQYHDSSGFLFFPFAVMAMVAFSRLLNTDWQARAATAIQPPTAKDGAASGKEKGPISYDY